MLGINILRSFFHRFFVFFRKPQWRQGISDLMVRFFSFFFVFREILFTRVGVGFKIILLVI